ncbi:diguanylate cyclase (GGDEF) domain-containing protein/HDIG domain-containing protein [Abditibacterium utsteinense]|uniref:Diguanylate cyclase (GGDEF) domain-containing protein/HDIG domain-containing protein n=1 Tax=Abditibacterium utsteinense TaxID=1960156 RepID=A0A2S8SR51_9BACT|nr:diguanylate cyclase [Abditibacterium utsteinense]PQV63291.1 diguanylate cyclase (GGDEF) domain-containing protein/HDIG domain-containing protein [Abditibacterium utsteinense]
MKRIVFYASLIYAIIFIGILMLHPGGPALKALLLFLHRPVPTPAQTIQLAFWYKAFQNAYQIIPPLLAGVCGLLYASIGVHENRIRRMGWVFIGLAALSFACGQVTWTIMETVLQLEMPAYGAPDIGYLAAYPLLFCGVILLFGSMPVTGRTRLLIDCALISGSVGVLSWYFLVRGWWQVSDVSVFGKLIFSSYPLGDIASLFGALVLYQSASFDRGFQRSTAMLSMGLIFLAFADTTFSYYNMVGLYQTGSWFDWGWPFGWLIIAWASLVAFWNPGQKKLPSETKNVHFTQAIASRGVLRVLEPYAAVAAAIGVMAMHDYLNSTDGSISLPVFVAGSFLIFLVILRQVLTLLENQHLTNQLRGFAANLEQMVLCRTQQLSALHQLTKAANNTLQIDQVIEAALTHTREAMQASGVVIKIAAQIGQNNEETTLRSVGLEERPEVLQWIDDLPLSKDAESVVLPSSFPTSIPATESGTDSQFTYLQAPLLHRGVAIGAIGVVRCNGQFAGTEPEMLESIGVEVGTAYENARLYGAALEAADRDPVTALFNHRAIHQRLDMCFNIARRDEHPLAVIMMDLNNFKLFNDTYGHPVGDQVLKRVADALRTDCREDDIIGRYGGDEFIVVLPGADGEVALQVAHRLRETMNREGFRRAGDQRTIPVTMSFGIAVYPSDADDRHELLTLADANLYNAKLSEHGIHSTSDLQRDTREFKNESSFNALDSMVVAIDNKDRYTRRHSEDVTEYGLWIAGELGLSQETQRVIRVGGLLHDIGKIGVPEDILRKPGRLTPEEFEVLKRHPQLGALIVGSMPDIEPITDIVRSHHERWDGGGYPDGIAGENIPLLGRLMAVADAFSAMTTQRPYRQGLAWDEALKEIELNLGTQFDPEMGRAFLRVARQQLAKLNATLTAKAPKNPSF